MNILKIKSRKLILLSVTTMDKRGVIAVTNVLHWSIYKCVLWLLCLIWYEKIALYRLKRFSERKRKYGNSDIGFISENTYACPYGKYEGDYYTGIGRDDCVFQNVFLCALSNRYTERCCSRSVVWISGGKDCRDIWGQ